MHPVVLPVEAAWKKLTGPDGLAARGSLENIEVGARRELTTAFGQTIQVEVLVHEPPFTLSMTIDNLEDSLLALDFERMGPKTFLYANLTTFRLDEGQVESLRQEWKRWIETLFPVPESNADLGAAGEATAGP